jgi:hypothetical protein
MVGGHLVCVATYACPPFPSAGDTVLPHPASCCPALVMCRYENEELLRHMWPTDVWFHVDDLSSAHVSGYMLLLT